MDASKLLLTQEVAQPTPLNNLSATSVSNKINSASEEEKKQISKDFESVLIGKLLDEMKTASATGDLKKTQLPHRFRGYSGCTWPVTLQITAALDCGKTYTNF